MSIFNPLPRVVYQYGYPCFSPSLDATYTPMEFWTANPQADFYKVILNPYPDRPTTLYAIQVAVDDDAPLDPTAVTFRIMKNGATVLEEDVTGFDVNSPVVHQLSEELVFLPGDYFNVDVKYVDGAAGSDVMLRTYLRSPLQ